MVILKPCYSETCKGEVQGHTVTNNSDNYTQTYICKVCEKPTTLPLGK